MRTALSSFLAVVGALAATTFASVPAHADADPAGPVLSTPGSGSTVQSGFTGPVTLDFTGAMPGSYQVDLSCNTAGQVATTAITYDGTTPPTAFSIPALTGPDTCTISGLVPETSTPWGGSFTVEAPAPPPTPALSLGNGALSATSFYPTVVDGYRDTVALTWTSNVPADHVVRVLNSRGSVVRSAAYSMINAGPHTWTWNGRNNSGTRMPAGTYRLQVTATDAALNTRSFTRSVTVATGYRYHRGSTARSGEVSSVATRGTCYATRSSYEALTNLDCWGGSYAIAAYTFRVPTGTYAVRYSVSGGYADSDICCDGRMTRSLTRVTPTAYRVKVRVNGWRAYDIYRVAVSYSWKVRI